MSKKKAPERRSRRVPAKAAVVLLAFSVIVVAAALTRRDAPRGGATHEPTVEPAAARQQGGLPLSKEYIYAGGQLVATEEPTPLPLGPPPTGLSATAVSAGSVRLTWAAPAGQVVSYRIERRQGGAFAQIAEVPGGASSPGFDDNGVTADSAYLYQVRAVFAGGGLSAFSNKDLATTIVFEDDPLVAGQTPVRFRHVQQVRGAVDAVRAVAGQGAADWSSPPQAEQHGSIHAAHIRQLRDNLNPALAALGIVQLSDDATLAAGQPIKAAHLQEVRQKVK